MKQNKYDNDAFFEKYSNMSRSKDGLISAGEWETLKELLPDFSGKRVLDLGCGYGWHCIYAAENGAKSVLGTDISEKMLAVAREKTSFECVEYACAAMEDLKPQSGSYDIVLSSLALHYIADFDGVARMVFDSLSAGGSFVFSCEHPVFTAHGSQDWAYDADGKIAYFPVDNYYIEGARETQFLGEPVTKYHRTLMGYIDTLLRCGFCIDRVVEPAPPERMLNIPGMRDELRRPMMLIISAHKPE